MFANFEQLVTFSYFYLEQSGTQQHVVGSGSQPFQREAEGIILQELFSTDRRLARLPVKTW